ncbi:hypothetical protein GFS24_06920 [Chitinophaga sp. SYP-B3965]|uniref:hypothetical protein n=1 Tax=Chitinophaga sp. SYP-B3965 TaxID=2663120 RepID=UPI0012999AC7|nr:hypothetical protein [Chitinophaga sp. SYP-B3965]MRG44839.1 hypothetical protein [Chitinophaga sp. SYP-B3965]
MRSHLFLFALMFSKICVSCQGVNKSDSSNCQKLYKEANNKLNEYYQFADQKKLDTVLSIIDENINACPEYEVKMVNLKVRSLTLLKTYDRGYKFIDSLDEAKFDKSYKKKFYLANFKVMALESAGDSAGIYKQYKKIIHEISEYVAGNPSDKDAIADLFFTKVKIESKPEVLRDLELMRQKNSIDSNFFDGLKTAIFENESVSNAIQK